MVFYVTDLDLATRLDLLTQLLEKLTFWLLNCIHVHWSKSCHLLVHILVLVHAIHPSLSIVTSLVLFVLTSLCLSTEPSSFIARPLGLAIVILFLSRVVLISVWRRLVSVAAVGRELLHAAHVLRTHLLHVGSIRHHVELVGVHAGTPKLTKWTWRLHTVTGELRIHIALWRRVLLSILRRSSLVLLRRLFRVLILVPLLVRILLLLLHIHSIL